MSDNERDSFVFYPSFLESVEQLSGDPDLQREVLLAICRYGCDGILPTPKDPATVRMIVAMAEPAIDAAKKRRNNGRRGGAPVRNSDNRKGISDNRKGISDNRKEPKMQFGYPNCVDDDVEVDVNADVEGDVNADVEGDVNADVVVEGKADAGVGGWGAGKGPERLDSEIIARLINDGSKRDLSEDILSVWFMTIARNHGTTAQHVRARYNALKSVSATAGPPAMPPQSDQDR